MKANSVGKKSIIKRYICSFLSVLVIPLIISSIGYGFSMNTVNKQLISHQITAQKNTVSIMDSNIGSIDEMALQLRLNNSLASLTSVNANELKSDDIRRMIEANKKTNNDFYISNHVFKERYYLVYPENGIVVTGSEVLAKLQFWYEWFFKFEGISYEQWHKSILECKEKTIFPEQTIKLNEKQIRAIPYVVPIGSMMNNDKKVAIFLLEKSQLQKIMGREDGSLISDYILDQNNNVIYSYGQPISEDLLINLTDRDKKEGSFIINDSIVVHVTSQLNSWTYVTVIPNHVAMGDAGKFRNILLTLTIIALLIGLLFLCYNSSKAAYPVKTALELINHAGDGITEPLYEFESLTTGVKQLITKNENLMQNVQKQNEQLQSAYMERILRSGVIDKSEEYADFNKKLHNVFNASNKVFVILIKLKNIKGITKQENLSTRSRLMMFLKNQINQIDGITENYFLYELYQDDFVLLVSNNNESTDAIEHHVSLIMEKLMDFRKGEELFTVGIGSCYSFDNIQQSYRQAKNALAYLETIQTGEMFCWAKEIPQDLNRFVFPLNTELSLVTAVKDGKMNEIKEIFEQLYFDNFLSNQLAIHMQICLIYNVYCTCIKSMPYTGISVEMRDLTLTLIAKDETQDYAELFQKMSQLILECVSSNSKTFDNGNRINKILEYVHSNYNRADLDISHIAEKFGLSCNYFSQYFKEQVGQNFSNYLETYRIQKATYYLSEESLSVQRIALLVGYSNVYTFRRAFKRIMGIVPTVFIEQI